MKYLFLLFSLFISHVYSQNYYTISVNKLVKEYPENNDFSTPLNAFVSLQYLWAHGKGKEANEKSSFRIRQRTQERDVEVNISTEKQFMFLNAVIKKVISYCDSVASIITLSSDSLYRCHYLNLEQGIWVNGGSDASTRMEEAEKRIQEVLPFRLQMLRRINLIIDTPKDTLAFKNYLKDYGYKPKDFLLNALAKYKLVIYGERHRRKKSWELLENIINDPLFPETTGTIFMELPSYKQAEIDKFFNKSILDSTIILNVFRDVQAVGWYDKGGFDFLISLWKLNKNLPPKKKIKIVFTDFQPEFRSIKTKEDFSIYEKRGIKRNTHMATVIEQTIKNNLDLRNTLFIVGYSHAYKSSNIIKYGESPEGDRSVACQLTERFSDHDIFCIRVHTSGINGYTRGGMFDYIFARNNRKPIAFSLKGSPFGKEIIEEWAFEKDDFGNFENNYDGYIYLGGEPIDKHQDYRLVDIYTKDFVQEIVRRSYLLNKEDEKWFGVPNKKLTLEDVLKNLNIE